MATYDLTNSIPAAGNIKSGDILNCPYSGEAVQIALPPGTYKLECWGAQGGNNATNYQGGYGGYSVGTISLVSLTYCYLCAGGQPSTGVSGGFNGGGDGFAANTNTGRGGGGASDIRIGVNSLYARAIVAGGGGGAARQSGAGSGTAETTSKCGGGESGKSASTGYAGTQTAGGGSAQAAGSFGKGGNAYSSSNQNYTPGGGGGGWYGGGSGTSGSSTAALQLNGGGSGYVYTSATAINYPSGCALNNAYYLSSASTKAGNTSFTDYSGSTTTGHSGNGAIRITVTSVFTVIAIPTLTDKAYQNISVSPTESGYNSSQMTKAGTTTAIMPGTYVITYTPKTGYMWPDGSTGEKAVQWKITSPFTRMLTWIYDSSL